MENGSPADPRDLTPLPLDAQLEVLKRLAPDTNRDRWDLSAQELKYLLFFALYGRRNLETVLKFLSNKVSLYYTQAKLAVLAAAVVTADVHQLLVTGNLPSKAIEAYRWLLSGPKLEVAYVHSALCLPKRPSTSLRKLVVVVAEDETPYLFLGLQRTPHLTHLEILLYPSRRGNCHVNLLSRYFLVFVPETNRRHSWVAHYCPNVQHLTISCLHLPYMAVPCAAVQVASFCTQLREVRFPCLPALPVQAGYGDQPFMRDYEKCPPVIPGPITVHVRQSAAYSVSVRVQKDCEIESAIKGDERSEMHMAGSSASASSGASSDGLVLMERRSAGGNSIFRAVLPNSGRLTRALYVDRLDGNTRDSLIRSWPCKAVHRSEVIPRPTANLNQIELSATIRTAPMVRRLVLGGGLFTFEEISEVVQLCGSRLEWLGVCPLFQDECAPERLSRIIVLIYHYCPSLAFFAVETQYKEEFRGHKKFSRDTIRHWLNILTFEMGRVITEKSVRIVRDHSKVDLTEDEIEYVSFFNMKIA